jgi:hypothetical protein
MVSVGHRHRVAFSSADDAATPSLQVNFSNPAALAIHQHASAGNIGVGEDDGNFAAPVAPTGSANGTKAASGVHQQQPQRQDVVREA